MTVIRQRNTPALTWAIAGPLVGIALWYWIDSTLGLPGVALGLGAAIIYLTSGVVRDLAAGGPILEHARSRGVMLAVVALPYVVLLAVGVPALVGLVGAMVVGPLCLRAAGAHLVSVERPLQAGPGSSVHPGRSGGARSTKSPDQVTEVAPLPDAPSGPEP
jgi:hypothetical protein